MRKLNFLFLGLMTLGGCAGGALRAKAASDFKCDEASITTQGVRGWAYYETASGCGKENWYVYDGQRWTSPLDRASFEIACPMDQLRATEIDKTTIGVMGCDKRVVYVLVPQIGGAKWVLNSTSTSEKSGQAQ
jgi:hypothetical protein